MGLWDGFAFRLKFRTVTRDSDIGQYNAVLYPGKYAIVRGSATRLTD